MAEAADVRAALANLTPAEASRAELRAVYAVAAGERLGLSLEDLLAVRLASAEGRNDDHGLLAAVDTFLAGEFLDANDPVAEAIRAVAEVIQPLEVRPDSSE